MNATGSLPLPTVSRVMVCSCDGITSEALKNAFTDRPFEVIRCRAADSLIEQVVRCRPAVVVYESRPDHVSDLAVLRLLKRAAPDVPLVLITCEGSLRVERLLRELRPAYHAVQPVEAEEIADAVRAVLERRQSRSA